MTMRRRSVTTLLAILAFQTLIHCFALCREPLGTYLDLGLQRALLTKYENFGLYGYPHRDDILKPQSDQDHDPDGGFACEDFVQTIVRDPREALPPSVAPPEVEEALGEDHLRWYLLSIRESGNANARDANPAQGSDIIDRAVAALEERGFEQGTTLFVFSDVRLALVLATTMEDFSVLLDQEIRDVITHLMENYPLVPALENASESVGVKIAHDAGYQGAGSTIAIVDTGVDPKYFQDRMIYMACFSSHRFPLTETHETVSNCLTEERRAEKQEEESRDARGAIDVDYEPTWHLGHGGEPCQRAYQCDHGTHVAYIAAGVDPSGESASGVAPEANVIAVQVASRAPRGYCVHAPGNDPCSVILPLDAILALHHLWHLVEGTALLSPSSAPGIPSAPLVAVNLSFRVSHACNKPDHFPEFEACDRESDEPYWHLASYDIACENPFSYVIDALDKAGVAVIVAAGNRKSEPIGVVSLPACVERAVTVSSAQLPTDTELFPRLAQGSMFSSHVDVAAPGHSIVTVGRTIKTGTSFAAPFVTGAVALVRQHLRSCGTDDSGAVARLTDHATALVVDDPEDPEKLYLSVSQAISNCD